MFLVLEVRFLPSRSEWKALQLFWRRRLKKKNKFDPCIRIRRPEIKKSYYCRYISIFCHFMFLPNYRFQFLQQVSVKYHTIVKEDSIEENFHFDPCIRMPMFRIFSNLPNNFFYLCLQTHQSTDGNSVEDRSMRKSIISILTSKTR